MQPIKRITRRALWIGPVGLAGAAAILLRHRDRTAEIPEAAGSDEDVTIARFDDSGTKLGLIHAHRMMLSEAEWRERLTPQQYYVTRRGQTDPAFTGTYYRAKEPGVFRCICCGEALFSSDAKYDSGTGWPSFWAPLAKENLRTRREPGVTLAVGIEVICARCAAHLGHVFDDGPRPTGLRYCINESSLRFVSQSSTNS